MRTMMRFAFVTGAFAALIPISGASAGDRVGNGGDVLSCRAAEGSSFSGLYTYDYVQKFDPRQPNGGYLQLSFDQTVTRLKTKFSRWAPEFIAALETFQRQIELDDVRGVNHWIAVEGALPDVADETTITKPRNCDVQHQAIRQVRLPGAGFEYTYDFQLLQEIKKSPLQYSMLMMHEFLWRYFEKSGDIYALNKVFHSSQLDSFSIVDLGLRFIYEQSTISFNLTPLIPLLVEADTDALVEALSEVLPTDGQSFSYHGLVKATDLVLKSATGETRKALLLAKKRLEMNSYGAVWYNADVVSFAMMFGRPDAAVRMVGKSWKHDSWPKDYSVLMAHALGYEEVYAAFQKHGSPSLSELLSKAPKSYNKYIKRMQGALR